MNRERETDQVTEMTIHKPSAIDLSRIIRAQIGQPQRAVTCVHEDHRRKVIYESLDLNNPERMGRILEQLEALSPETEILDRTIVHAPSVERRRNLRLETDINGDTWRIHFDPNRFSNPALTKIVGKQIRRIDPTEILLIKDNLIRRKIDNQELLEESRMGKKSFNRFLNEVVSDMLESDKVIVQFS